MNTASVAKVPKPATSGERVSLSPATSNTASPASATAVTNIEGSLPGRQKFNPKIEAELLEREEPGVWHTVKRIFQIGLKGNKTLMAANIACNTAASLCTFKCIELIGQFADRLQAGASANSLSTTGIIIGSYFFLSALRIATNVISARQAVNLSFQIKRSINEEQSQSMLGFDLATFEKPKFKDLHKFATDNTSRIQSFIQNGLRVVPLAIDFALATAVFATNRWEIAVAMVGIGVLNVFARKRYAEEIKANEEELVQGWRKQGYLSFVLNSALHLKELILLNRTAYFNNRRNDILYDLQGKNVELQRRNTSREGYLGALSLAVEGGALIYVMNAATTSSISVGTAVFLLGALKRFDSVTSNFSAVASALLEHVGFLRKCMKLIDSGQELKKMKESSYYVPLDYSKGVEIKLENVSFAYPGKEKPVFENLNLTIKPGQFIGIVGDIGSGKSTLTNLITGAYQPSAGRVLINGFEISEISPSEWRNQIAFMNQTSPLFETLTLEEFIQMGSSAGQDSSIAKVTAATGTDEIINRTPHGAKTVIGEGFDRGQRFSSGETQLLLATRALNRDPKVLILDEPTSNLDIERERRLTAALASNAEGTRTRLVISHRYGSLRAADKILVIEAGRIVEVGSHDELMQLDGIYARKCRMQNEKESS